MESKKPSPGGEGGHQGASTSCAIRSLEIYLRKEYRSIAPAIDRT